MALSRSMFRLCKLACVCEQWGVCPVRQVDHSIAWLTSCHCDCPQAHQLQTIKARFQRRHLHITAAAGAPYPIESQAAKSRNLANRVLQLGT